MCLVIIILVHILYYIGVVLDLTIYDDIEEKLMEFQCAMHNKKLIVVCTQWSRHSLVNYFYDNNVNVEERGSFFFFFSFKWPDQPYAKCQRRLI